MSAKSNHRQEVRQAAADAMAVRYWTQAEFAAAAGIDVGTIGQFLAGRRWPSARSQASIERALGWQPGTINRCDQQRAQAPEASWAAA